MDLQRTISFACAVFFLARVDAGNERPFETPDDIDDGKILQPMSNLRFFGSIAAAARTQNTLVAKTDFRKAPPENWKNYPLFAKKLYPDSDLPTSPAQRATGGRSKRCTYCFYNKNQAVDLERAIFANVLQQEDMEASRKSALFASILQSYDQSRSTGQQYRQQSQPTKAVYVDPGAAAEFAGILQQYDHAKRTRTIGNQRVYENPEAAMQFAGILQAYYSQNAGVAGQFARVLQQYDSFSAGASGKFVKALNQYGQQYGSSGQNDGQLTATEAEFRRILQDQDVKSAKERAELSSIMQNYQSFRSSYQESKSASYSSSGSSSYAAVQPYQILYLYQ